MSDIQNDPSVIKLVEYAKAKLSYFHYPEKIAKAKFNYPGIEAFYE